MCSDNILSCNEPNDKSMFGGVLSEVKTRTLPAGMQGHQLSFHYICGELCMSMMRKHKSNLQMFQVEILLVLARYLWM